MAMKVLSDNAALTSRPARAPLPAADPVRLMPSSKLG
jgi:hypothetical protein